MGLTGKKGRLLMASRVSGALQLPKITIENRYDYDKEEMIKEMMASPVLITS
jgi:hypothetical protein